MRVLAAKNLSVFLVTVLALAGGVARAQVQAAPLTLGAAVAQAQATSPAITAAAQQLAQSQALLAQAQGGRRFQITFNSTTSGTDASFFQPPPAYQRSYTEQNTLTVPLPLGSRPALAVRQAQDQLEAARAQYTSARVALASQVSTAYYDLLRKQALLLIAQQTLLQAQRGLAEARARNGAGDVPQLDVLRAQVPVALAQSQQVLAASDVAVARETLAGLIGQSLDYPLVLADVPPDDAPSTQTLDQARAQALAYSPDVRAAQATVRADQAALDAARLYREPVVSVQVADARSNDQTGFSRADTVLASVTIPLSDGGVGSAGVRAAQAALAGAQAQVEAARRSALIAISTAFLTSQSAYERVGAARAARDIAQTSADKTELGYRNGLFPLTDVLNAQATLTQAQIAYTQAVYEAAAAESLTDALNGVSINDFPGPALAPTPTTPSAPGGGGGAGGPAGTGTAGTAPAGAATPGSPPAGSTTTGANPGGANAPAAGAP